MLQSDPQHQAQRKEGAFLERPQPPSSTWSPKVGKRKANKFHKEPKGPQFEGLRYIELPSKSTKSPEVHCLMIGADVLIPRRCIGIQGRAIEPARALGYGCDRGVVKISQDPQHLKGQGT